MADQPPSSPVTPAVSLQLAPPGVVVVVVTVLALVCLVTVGGNLLVLVSFWLNSDLRHAGNYYIVSMATSDLFIGGLCLPFAIQTQLFSVAHHDWFCLVFEVLDNTLLYVSEFGVLLITLDRYQAITSPIKHRRRSTKKRALVCITCNWTIIFGFYSAIYCWMFVLGRKSDKYVCHRKTMNDHNVCNHLLMYSYEFTNMVTFFMFWVPLMFMFIAYYDIYKVMNNMKKGEIMRVISQKARRPMASWLFLKMRKSLTREQNHANADCPRVEGAKESDTPAHVYTEAPRHRPGQNQTSTNNNGCLSKGHTRDHSVELPPDDSTLSIKSVKCSTLSTRKSSGSYTPANGYTEVPRHRLVQNKVSTNNNSCFSKYHTGDPSVGLTKDDPPVSVKSSHRSTSSRRKSWKTISLILGAFVVFWTPLHVVLIAKWVCPECVSTTVHHITLFMCYLNSTFNPFLYALANPSFRRTYLRVLKLDCHRA